MGEDEKLMAVSEIETMIQESGGRRGREQDLNQEFRGATSDKRSKRGLQASHEQPTIRTNKFDLSQNIDTRRSGSNISEGAKVWSSAMNLHAPVPLRSSKAAYGPRESRQSSRSLMALAIFLAPILLISCQLSTMTSAWRLFDTLESGINVARQSGDYFHPSFMNHFYSTAPVNLSPQPQLQLQTPPPPPSQQQQPNFPIYNPQEQQLLTPSTSSSPQQQISAPTRLATPDGANPPVTSQGSNNNLLVSPIDGVSKQSQHQQQLIKQDQFQGNQEAIRASASTSSQTDAKLDQPEPDADASPQLPRPADHIVVRQVSQVGASAAAAASEPVKPVKQLETQESEQLARQDAPLISVQFPFNEQKQQHQQQSEPKPQTQLETLVSSQPSPFGKIFDSVLQAANESTNINEAQARQQQQQPPQRAKNHSRDAGNKLTKEVGLQTLRPKKASCVNGDNKSSVATEQQIIDQHARAAAGYSHASQYSSASSSSSSSSSSSLASNSSPQQRLLPATKHRDNKLLGSLLLHTLGAVGTESSASASSLSPSSSSSSDKLQPSSPFSSLLDNFKSGISSRSSLVKAAISDNKLARTLTTVSKSIGGNKYVASAGIAAALAALGLTVGKLISPHVMSSQYSKLSEPLLTSGSFLTPSYMTQDRNFAYNPSFGSSAADSMFTSASNGQFILPTRTGSQPDFGPSDGFTFAPMETLDGSHQSNGHPTLTHQQSEYYPQHLQSTAAAAASMLSASPSTNNVYFAPASHNYLHPAAFSSQQTNYNNNKQPYDSANGHYSNFYNQPEIDSAVSAAPVPYMGGMQAQQYQQQQFGQYISGSPSQTTAGGAPIGYMDAQSATNYGTTNGGGGGGSGGSGSQSADKSEVGSSDQFSSSAGLQQQQQYQQYQQLANSDQLMSSSSIDNPIYQKVPATLRAKGRAGQQQQQQPPRRSGAVTLKLDESTRYRLEKQLQNQVETAKPYQQSYSFFTLENYPRAKAWQSGGNQQETIQAADQQRKREANHLNKRKPLMQQQVAISMTNPQAKAQTLVESSSYYDKWTPQIKQSHLSFQSLTPSKASRFEGAELAAAVSTGGAAQYRAQVNQVQDGGQLHDASRRQQQQQQRAQEGHQATGHDKGGNNSQVQPTYMLIRPNTIDQSSESLEFTTGARNANQQQQRLQPIVATERELNSSASPSTVAYGGGWISMSPLTFGQQQQAQQQQKVSGGHSEPQGGALSLQPSEEGLWTNGQHQTNNSSSSSNNNLSSLHRVSRTPQQTILQPIVTQYGPTKTKSSSEPLRYFGATELRDYAKPAAPAQEGHLNRDSGQLERQQQQQQQGQGIVTGGAATNDDEDKLASTDRLQLLAAMMSAQQANVERVTDQLPKVNRFVYENRRLADTNNEAYKTPSSLLASDSIRSETFATAEAASRVQGGGDKSNEVTTTNNNDNGSSSLGGFEDLDSADKGTQIRHAGEATGVDSELIDGTTVTARQHQASDESTVANQQQHHHNHHSNDNDNNFKQSQRQQPQPKMAAGGNVVVELMVGNDNEGGKQ